MFYNSSRYLQKQENSYWFKLKNYNINVDIPETGKTFYENVLIKAKAIYELTKIPTIADDSGLIFLELNNGKVVSSLRKD